MSDDFLTEFEDEKMEFDWGAKTLGMLALWMVMMNVISRIEIVSDFIKYISKLINQ